MKAPPLLLDFSAPRMRVTLLGMVLLVFGLCAVTLACLEYRVMTQRHAGLEMRLADLTRRAARNPAEVERNVRLSEEATGITRELGTPWTGVLADLEAAAKSSEGQISLLALEPDHEKHRILIKAESKDLSLALDYLKRLQQAHSLRFPMLDSHEVVAEDKDRPVRFSMTADWREAP